MLEYLQGVKTELLRVRWPSQTKATYLTILVILLSFAAAAYFGVFDYLFSGIIENFVI